MSQQVDLLGEPELLQGADRAALLPAAATAGAQVRATIAALGDAAAALADLKPRALLVIADGRAVHDAALFAALLGPACPVPVLVRAELPVWVGALDVVVVLESGTPTEAAAAAVAQRRGATVLVRGATRGELAEATPGQLYPPRIGIPEVLAGPARLAFLLGVASALGLLRPALDEEAVETVADLLDTEALACAPQTDAFVNPAISLAQQFTSADLVLSGLDPVAQQLARHASVALAELSGVAAPAFGAGELVLAASLMTRLGKARDIFTDPFEDPEEDRAPLLPVVLRVTTPADARIAQLAGAWFRSIQQALPKAVIVDGPELSLAPLETVLPEQKVHAEPVGWIREWASTALVMLRLDFAAVYLGLAEGQVTPLDAPAGLGAHDGARQLLQPDTVVSSYRDEEDFDRWN
jgi:hypothetical protein